MLSKEELARYGTGTLTDVFIARVFQECLTYDGEMVCLHIIYLLVMYCSHSLNTSYMLPLRACEDGISESITSLIFAPTLYTLSLYGPQKSYNTCTFEIGSD